VNPPAIARILLDECVPRRLRREMSDADVSHAVDEGWAGQRNGALIELMLERGFRILVTVDRNLQFQQNIAASGVAVVVLHARSNRITDLRLLIPPLREALVRARPGEIVRVGV
jgi:hypothetical protein